MKRKKSIEHNAVYHISPKDQSFFNIFQVIPNVVAKRTRLKRLTCFKMPKRRPPMLYMEKSKGICLSTVLKIHFKIYP